MIKKVPEWLFRKESILAWFLCLLLVAFIGTLFAVSLDHKKHVAEFNIKCKSKGGVMFMPSGHRGWPAPECRNPTAMISIN